MPGAPHPSAGNVEPGDNPLLRIREQGEYSSRNTSKGALLHEAHAVFSAVRDGLSADCVREAILQSRLFQKTSFETRRKIWNLLDHRYFAPRSEWIVKSLARASAAGAHSPDFASLAYLYFALRDAVTFDFVVEPVWESWQTRTRAIGRSEFAKFLEAAAVHHPSVRRWRETTRSRLSASTLAALRDFGLLRGQQSKQIQRPPATLETAYHLLAILVAEGNEGRSILEATDWRLFLWSESDVADALGKMAQNGWVRFERGGRTVILEMVRQPEVTA